MTHLEMRNLDMHYDPEDTEMSAQERLLFNNNFNSNHQQQPLPASGLVLDDDGSHYQVPYAHLHQHHYLQHQQQLQQQQMPGMYSGSSSSDGRSFRPSTPRLNGHHSPNPNGHYTTNPNGHYSPNPNGHYSPNLNLNPYHSTGNAFHDKYSVAYPVVPGDHMRHGGMRSAGSGIVYRPRRKLWWFIAMVILFLLLVAGAVVIALYFTVLKKDLEPQAIANDNVHTNDEPTPGTGGDVASNQPPYNIPRHDSTPHPPRGSFFPSFLDTKVDKFEAFWHPGDSRLFVAYLSNDTVIQTFGPKKSDGTVKSLYSITMTPRDKSKVTSVQFMDSPLSIASVVLPSGTVVTYDYSANKPHDMEINIFELNNKQSSGPISHIAHVEGGVYTYAIRKITEVMNAVRKPREFIDRRRGSTKCFSRFPVKVSKCGGGIPYDKAYVQGLVTGTEKPITMAALPWPKDRDPDPCFATNADNKFNYYIPLPGYVDDTNATMIKDAHKASSGRIFAEICNVMNSQKTREHNELCNYVSKKVSENLGGNHQHHLRDIMQESCGAILNSLKTTCFAISAIASVDNTPTLTEMGLMNSLNPRLSNSFHSGLSDTLNVKVHAFCPSFPPKSSFDNTVNLNDIRQNVAQDDIAINCDDTPEIQMLDLNHMLAKSPASPSAFNQVKHKMRICSSCALEKRVSVKIISEHMTCNNTCAKSNSVEVHPDIYVEESKTFYNKDRLSIYCHEFLTQVDNRIDNPIGHHCVGNCFSNLKVNLKIKDTLSNLDYYDQTVQCSEYSSGKCKMKFGR